MKKKILTLVSLVLAASMLAGCSGPWSIYSKLKKIIFHESDNEVTYYTEEEAAPVEDYDTYAGGIEESSTSGAKVEKDLTGSSVAPQEEVYVSNALEFVEAIESNRIIHLSPGTYNISEAIEGLGMIPYDEQYEITEPTVGASECFDGNELLLLNIDNLTIMCDDVSKQAELVCEPRYANVIDFYNCTNISLFNIVAGHTPERGSCAGDVINFESCDEITLSIVDLYGCGTYGIGAYESENILCRMSKIRECSYGLVDFCATENVVFDDCTFTFDEGYSQIECRSESQLTFNNCVFQDRGSNSDFVFVTDDSVLVFKGCTFDITTRKSLKQAESNNVVVIN